MKKKLTLIYLLLVTNMLFGQAPPNAFNYSGVARDALGNPIANSTIGIQISILINSPLGAIQYQENHFVNTDNFGLFNLIIGAGAIQQGVFANIDWGIDNYYLKVGMDANGGSNFLTMGTTQLISVPYALYAKSAGTVSGGVNEIDPIFNSSPAGTITNSDITNWNSKISVENDPVFNSSVAGGITSLDTTKWNNKQNQLSAGTGINIVGNTISTTGGTAFTHYVGEIFGGGVVFHVYKDGTGTERGLIVALTDQSTGHMWSNVNTVAVGPTAQSSWDGLNNSNAIIAQPGHTSSAAALCLNLVSGGFSDWYLASIDEMLLLFNARYNVNKTLSTIAGATILPHQSANYGTSTEFSSYSPWWFNFEVGYPQNWNTPVANFYPKSDMPLYVRAIRQF
jgi:hypothetical protein